MAFKTVNEVLAALQAGEINQDEASLEIDNLKKDNRVAGFSTKVNETGTLSARSSLRNYPLASLYRDEWELFLAEDNITALRDALKNPKVTNRPLREK